MTNIIRNFLQSVYLENNMEIYSIYIMEYDNKKYQVFDYWGSKDYKSTNGYTKTQELTLEKANELVNNKVNNKINDGYILKKEYLYDNKNDISIGATWNNTQSVSITLEESTQNNLANGKEIELSNFPVKIQTFKNILAISFAEDL